MINYGETAKENTFVYTFKADGNEDGKYSKIRKVIDLDEAKEYIVLFTPKNRFGETQPQLVYERNMSFNTLKEIGYVEVQYDGFKR